MSQQQQSQSQQQQQQHSAMSIDQLVNTPDDMDPDVKMAVEALGDMARSKVHMTLPPLSTPSTTPSSPLPTPTSSSIQRLSFSSSTLDEPQQSRFIYRVSNIPIVNSAIRVYEHSKNSSSVVKYGAEMVESFAGPIYDKLGKPVLSNVDEWGCKQLDKLEEKYPYLSKNKETDEDEQDEDDANSTVSALARTSLLDDHESTTSGLRKRRDSKEEFTLKNTNRSRTSSRSTSPHKPYPKPNARHRPIAPRSKWHQIVLHASSAAGTTAAVVSEESMKCLRYCLSWLQYASQHIEQQMNLIRKYLVSIAKSSQDKAVVVAQESPLPRIKKEIVDTLRKVVDVISKYAGTGLPEQAKAAVRSFILALPSRWAMLNSKAASPVASPALKPSDVGLHETSIKLLNFSGESLEMIQSVAHVFSDTIERAELWLSRLAVVSGSSQQVKPAVEQMDLN
ncbi:hypothetical protein RMATCC62417_01344 [Rhizopus microsporus]|nr:hypothetical protein RMATCC62417_01344 [Rhizopus microsporus]